ncbi:MAG: hypothetical protein P8Y45_21645, partial [Exilibacterium sp.]
VGGRLVRLEENLNAITARHLYHEASVLEWVISSRAIANSQLVLGLSLSTDELAQDSREVMQEVLSFQRWLKEKAKTH